MSRDYKREPGHLGDGYRADHPSFGVIELHRIQGSFPNLVGVDFEQGHAISLRIKTATQNRTHGSTRFFAQELIAEVYMSETQFAKMITGLNTGEDNPVTIRYRQDGPLKDVPYPPKHMENFDDLAEEAVEPIKDTVQALEELVASFKDPKFSKARARELAEKALRELSQNYEFMVERGIENIQKAGDRTKQEILAYGEQVVRQFGLDAIGAAKAALPNLGEQAQIEDQSGD
jgi:vacuolar-type H+-ATPase subunit H